MVNSMKLVTSDILRQVGSSVINFFNRREYIVSPADGTVLKLYYKYTFWLLMSGFAAVYYNWYTRDIIVCTSHYNVDAQIRTDYLNMCATWPYRVIDGKKEYMLYYKWVHWVMLLSALAFYIPHKLVKRVAEHRLSRFLEQVNTMSAQGEAGENNLIITVCRYFFTNAKRQDNIYYRYLGSNVVAMFISISLFFLYDVMFFGKFKSLGYDAFPFVRDGKFLTDPLHQTFYPFVNCQIGDGQQLVNERKETFGCHLTAQEFYEKLFLVLWFVFIFLMIVSTIYVLFLLCFFLKYFRRFLIKWLVRSKNVKKIDQIIDDATENFGIGDWFLLYKLRSGFFGKGFEMLLHILGDRELHQKCMNIGNKHLPTLPCDNMNRTPKEQHHAILME